ncbi:carbohydrate ABC transporter permease [Sphingomonas aliaeris]|uniref:sn-glycerol-3-phosphate transport system permease protein UgpE n=1 Tax=Sphingomonas aliaeris TaxID=2759526 RepID=A0A974S4L0_9SPHN|nr:carbohydrate ABC transporter permease [Sphingomonas aliaeris]QQV77636.1 carbohydrate ABC transporter permease [Sphingomonas aliaeris]
MTPRTYRFVALRFAIYALMALLGMIFIFPFLFMLSASFKGNDAIFADLESMRALLPVGDLTTENYANVFGRGDIGHFLFNSVFITVFTVGTGLIVNSLAAFSLARLEWRGKEAALTVLVILLIVPFEAITVPLMLLVAKLPGLAFTADGLVLTRSWLDTLYVQIVPFVSNAFSIFLFYQFFRDIPKDFDEAAYVDGATPLQVYRHVILPSSAPVFATVSILQALAMWNQYLWPVVTVPGMAARPLMVGMQQFFGRTTAWGEVMAYAAVITVPVLIAFIVFQLWFVRSVVGSGVKG